MREDQGKLPAAMEAYRAAAAAGAELMRRAPGDVEREAAYAETLHHLGNAYWFQGDLNHALECFQQAIALLQRAVTLRPTDTGWPCFRMLAPISGGFVRRAGSLLPRNPCTSCAHHLSDSHIDAPRRIRWKSDLADAAESLAKVP